MPIIAAGIEKSSSIVKAATEAGARLSCFVLSWMDARIFGNKPETAQPFTRLLRAIVRWTK